MRGHSPNITKEVEDTLVFVKGHFPNMKPKQIQAQIKQNLKAYKLKENQVPSVRSIQNKLKKPENRKKIEKIKSDALNRYWNIGLGLKYGISAGIVPVLIQIAQFESNSDELTYDLTIRKARWVEYLFPTLEPIIKKQRPRLNSMQRIWLLYNISEEYAKLQEVNEIRTGEKSPDIPAPDTSDLDYTFLIKEDVSAKTIGNVGSIIRFPEIMEQVRSMFSDDRMYQIKKRPITKEELKPFLGEVPQKEVDRLNKQLQKAAKELKQYPKYMEKDGEEK